MSNNEALGTFLFGETNEKGELVSPYQCRCMGGETLRKRVADLEAALKPFAEAYEILLDNAPSPDVIINTVQKGRYTEYGKKPATVQWSDLYRAANLLRETPHA